MPNDPKPTAHRFEALAESSADAILTIDERSTILSANSSTQRIFGWSPAEIVGRPITILMPERLRARHTAGLRQYVATGARRVSWAGLELTGLTRDGREIPVEISFGEFTDPTGRRIFSGFVRDVSERIERERALAEARRSAEAALKRLATLGRITDVALASATYDAMLAELLRRLREELRADDATVLLVDRGRRFLDIRARDGRSTGGHRRTRFALGEGLAGRVASTGQPMLETKLQPSALSAAAVPVDSDGRLIGVLQVAARSGRAFTHDDLDLLAIVADRMAGVFARARLYTELEERERVEHALRDLAQAIGEATRVPEVMRRIVDGALAVSDARGAYVEQIMTGKIEVEVVAASGSGMPTPGQRLPYPGSLTEEIIGRGEPVFLNRLEGLGKAMAPYLAEDCPGCSAMVLPLRAGTDTLGALVVLRDPDEPAFEERIVTRLRTLADLASIALQRLLTLAESERRRERAEAAVRSRDEVLSIVSHDLRNPLNTVKMSASLLGNAEIPLTDDQRRQQIEIIERSADRMNRLIQDLLDAAKIEGGRLTLSCRCIDAAALVTEAHEAFRPLAEDKSITLRYKAGDALPRVWADRDRLLQALLNYLNNAAKFTPAGGCIEVRAAARDGGVVFAVADSGPGVAAADLPHIFDRFWQAKRTAHLGTGLGLAIVRGIAEAHRGRAWAESVQGHGATFYLSLPRAKECE